MKRNKRPTLADVARHARVSSATASRVLGNTGPVSQELRERIQKAVAALGYVPRKRTAPAQSPAEGTLAVLAGDLLNPFFPQVVRGIQDEADNYGMILTLYNLTDHPQRQQQLIQRLSRQRIDGVIVMGTSPFPELLAWRDRSDVPLVVINRRYNQAGVHCILVDFENAMRQAAQHLLSLNHARIGYLSAFSTSQIAAARQCGLDAALAEAGLSLRPEWCASVPPGVEIDGGFQAMMALLDLAPQERPTGVIAFNDVVALGALHAARTRGLRVPQNLSLIGVDDIFASAHTDPPLTTIGQPKYRMGALAVQTLRRIRQGQMSTPCSCTVLESPLIVRQSTGPAPQPGPNGTA
jgi:DNA-binding LacI/PurR family transcriptional regulator